MLVVYIHFEVGDPTTISLTPKKYGMSSGSSGFLFAVNVFREPEKNTRWLNASSMFLVIVFAPVTPATCRRYTSFLSKITFDWSCVDPRQHLLHHIGAMLN